MVRFVYGLRCYTKQHGMARADLRGNGEQRIDRTYGEWRHSSTLPAFACATACVEAVKLQASARMMRSFFISVRSETIFDHLSIRTKTQASI